MTDQTITPETLARLAHELKDALGARETALVIEEIAKRMQSVKAELRAGGVGNDELTRIVSDIVTK